MPETRWVPLAPAGLAEDLAEGGLAVGAQALARAALALRA